jgi:hypothetical protein
MENFETRCWDVCKEEWEKGLVVTDCEASIAQPSNLVYLTRNREGPELHLSFEEWAGPRPGSPLQSAERVIHSGKL